MADSNATPQVPTGYEVQKTGANRYSIYDANDQKVGEAQTPDEAARLAQIVEEVRKGK